MRIRRSTLKRIIREAGRDLEFENLKKLLKKHVRYGVGLNKMVDAIMADPDFDGSMSKEQVADAVHDYNLKMMGF